MIAHLHIHAAIVAALRQTAEAAGCLEVETPVLVRPTPGGATPFLVPHAGRNYAQAQSPQVWKQLLVCGGIERYCQLAHCFRNEGARPERQPEFSPVRDRAGLRDRTHGPGAHGTDGPGRGTGLWRHAARPVSSPDVSAGHGPLRLRQATSEPPDNAQAMEVLERQYPQWYRSQPSG